MSKSLRIRAPKRQAGSLRAYPYSLDSASVSTSGLTLAVGTSIAAGSGATQRTSGHIRIRRIVVHGSFCGNDVFQSCRLLIATAAGGPITLANALTPGTKWCDSPNEAAGVRTLYDHVYGFVPGTYDGTVSHYPTVGVNVDVPCDIELYYNGSSPTCNDVGVFLWSDSGAANHPTWSGYATLWFEVLND